MVKVNFYYLAQDGFTYKKTLSYMNPNASDETILQFVQKLNDLTTNKLGDVYKVVNDFLDHSETVIQEDDELITAEEIQEIMSGDFVEVYDADGITQIEINSILDGNYQPVEDSDEISQEFFDDLFE